MTKTLVLNVILQKIAIIMIRSRPGRRQKNIKPDTPRSGRRRIHSSRLVLRLFPKSSTSFTAVVANQISRVRKEALMMLPNTQVKIDF